jgi:hypothetical protein
MGVRETLTGGSRLLQSITSAPHFCISGRIHRTNCPVNLPFTGEVRVGAHERIDAFSSRR